MGARTTPVRLNCRICLVEFETFAMILKPFCSEACFKEAKLSDVEWFGACGYSNCPRAQRNKSGLCDPHYQQRLKGKDLRTIGALDDPAERFWQFVSKGGEEECWLWTGGKIGGRYGAFIVKSERGGEIRERYAHRFSHTIHNGEIPEGYVVDHTCYTTLCVNPAHLQAVTPQENVQNRSGLNSNNTSGFRGVSFNKRRGKYMAYIRLNRQHRTIGYFEDPAEAALAASKARQTYYTNSLKDGNNE